MPSPSTPSRVRIAEVEHVHRGAAGIGADIASSPIRIWYLRLDRITVVTSASRAPGSTSPARVYMAEPSACRVITRRARARSRPGRQRVPLPMAPPHDLQPVVRRRAVGLAEEDAAEAHALVDDDRVLRHHRRERAGQALGVGCPRQRISAAGRVRAWRPRARPARRPALQRGLTSCSVRASTWTAASAG